MNDSSQTHTPYWRATYQRVYSRFISKGFSHNFSDHAAVRAANNSGMRRSNLEIAKATKEAYEKRRE